MSIYVYNTHIAPYANKYKKSRVTKMDGVHKKGAKNSLYSKILLSFMVYSSTVV